MKPVIYKLKTPVEVEGAKVERLEFKPPKGKHIKKINLQNISMTDLMEVGAKISGQTPKVFDEMYAEDVMACNEIVADFLVPGQQIT